MQKFEHNLTANSSGALRPLSGAAVTVTDNANGLPAALYSDNGVTPLAQPLITDNTGYFGFYAADGKYTITFSGSRFETFTRQILLEDPDDNPALTAQELALVNGSSKVGFAQDAPGAVPRKVQDKLGEVVSVKDFGAKGDGVVDDTAASLAAHTYANSVGMPVSYQGMARIALQANAQIPVKTSVNFHGCEIVILGGVAGAPSFNTFNDLFVVTDDACPLTTVTGAVAAGNLGKGSLFPTLGLFDGHGYALVECALQVPNRAKTGTANYTQSFKINRSGRASAPLSADLSAYAAAITVSYRKTSAKRLTLENLAVVEGAWNNQRILKISRCNVEVKNFPFLFTGAGTAFDNICEIISIDNASDIFIDGFVTTGRPVTTTSGSYCLAIYGGADIYVDKMNALTGWGAVGSNNVNNLHFTRSVLNRIDSHSSGHNLFADNCDLHEKGMVYGWGGGILSVKNTRLHRCPAVATREDYGGTFFGDIVVTNCETENSTTSTLYVVDLLTNPLGASTAVYAPTTISVSNVKRTGKASGNNAELVPVAVKVRGATDVVYAPTSVDVRSITSHPSWRFGLRLDTLNLEANQSNPVTAISFADVYPDVAATSATGVLDLASIRTPTTPVRPTIRGSNADNIHIQNLAAANLTISLNNVGLNGLKVDTAAAAQPTVTINGGKLAIAASGYTNAPIGGGTSGTSGYTTLNGVEIPAVAFDLSLVAAFIGCTVRNGATPPLLPFGVTASLAFTGWRKAGAFAS